MAGGLGSRYGGLKQVDSFGPNNESLLDYSIYDALKTGFNQIVIVSSLNLKGYFINKYKKKFEKIQNCNLEVVIQDPNYGLEKYNLPKSRKKPWGTGHAVLCCENAINNSFCIINADDFYGRNAFVKIIESLKYIEKNKIQACVVSYLIENTLSSYGGVSRGICQTNKNHLLSIKETHELKINGSIINGKLNEVNVKYPLGTEVSMNLIGFQKTIFNKLRGNFLEFLSDNLNSPKNEFLIPDLVNDLIKDKVYVQKTKENWFGVTYQADKKLVIKKIRELIKIGKYPNNLWI